MSPIKLLIVDDHSFFLASLLPPLKAAADILVVGTAASGEQAIDLCDDLHPDVVLLDLNLPYLSGLATLERLMLRRPSPAILILTGADDAESVACAFAAGAQGYLRKDLITDELLISAIFAVASGGIATDAKTFALLKFGFLSRQFNDLDEQARLTNLTPDESLLLRYVALGYGNDQISQKLQITPKTVSNRLSQIYLRLQVDNRVQAAIFALRAGLATLSETTGKLG